MGGFYYSRKVLVKKILWLGTLAFVAGFGHGLLATKLRTKSMRPTNHTGRTAIQIRMSSPSSEASASLGDSPTKVVIVGGGVGGLALASRLATLLRKRDQANFQITLLEKNAQVGGRCGSVHIQLPEGTFRHETGPSLLLLPHIYRRLFEDCNGAGNTQKKSMEDYGLKIQPCLPAYQVVFDDGDCIDVGFSRQTQLSSTQQAQLDEAEQLSRAKMNSWEPEGTLKWDAYLRACEAFLDCGLPNFIEERFDVTSFPAFLRESLRDGAKAWPLLPHSDVLEGFFESTKLRALASFQDLYVGLEPYRNNQQILGGVWDSTAPAVFGLLSAIELHPRNAKCGVYAPMGGFAAVTQSLQKLAKEGCGVHIRTGQRVTRITSNGVWYCVDDDHDVKTNGDGDDGKKHFEPADLVIVNADLPYATQSLTTAPPNSSSSSSSQHETFDWDDKYRYSSGVIAFHWSMDMALDKLNTHNVFLSAARNSQDAQDGWQALRDPSKGALLATDTPFNFYVHRASKTDPTAAPEGMDAILVLVPCPVLQRNTAMAQASRQESLAYYNSTITAEMIDTTRQAVLHRFGVLGDEYKNLKSHIVHEFVDTPATYANQYHVAAGTPFALSHGLGQLSLTRPSARTGNIPNVLYVGASSRPGNGVPLVLVGAELVARQAAQYLQRRSSSSEPR